MRTHPVIIDFARKYGVKEGLILTELCRRMRVSGEAAIPFSVSRGKEHFPYLTEKQLRRSLENLREQGCIRRTEENEKTVDRTARFQINKKLYQYYIQAMIADQDILNEDMPPSPGEF
jgi:hypothetical protein